MPNDIEKEAQKIVDYFFEGDGGEGINQTFYGFVFNGMSRIVSTERQKTIRECLEMVGEYVEIPKAIPVRDNQELAKAIINLQEQGRIDGANNEKSRLRALLKAKLEK